MRTVTGSVKSTPIDHIHSETKPPPKISPRYEVRNSLTKIRPVTDNMHKSIHTFYTQEAVNNLTNPILKTHHLTYPQIPATCLIKKRVLLWRARSGHLLFFTSYKFKIGISDKESCRACNQNSKLLHMFSSATPPFNLR